MWIWLSIGLYAAAWECGNTEQWDQIHQTDQYITSSGPFLRSIQWSPIRIALRPLSPLDLETQQALADTLNWLSNLLLVQRLETQLQSQGCTGYGIAEERYDADFVLYVLIDQAKSQYAARTVLCTVEGGNSLGAPLSGLVILYPQAIQPTKRLVILRHELSHLLAISTFLFPRYRSPTGSVYIQSLAWVQSRNETIPVLRTPAVTRKVRQTFGCEEAVGVELDIGREGGVEAHWRGRMMHMDYMVNGGNERSVYSDITLGAFEDSGWYRVQPNGGNRLPYGYKRGCSFLSSLCISAEKAVFPEFCDTSSGDLCTIDQRFKATCGLRRYPSPLPPLYQYFSDPYLGGFSQDYCPIPVPDQDGDCSDGSAFPSLINTEAYGEMACPSCLCFTGSYIKPQWALKGMPIHSGCHRVECTEGFAVVYIGAEAVKCPKKGGVVGEIKGFIGNITCPEYEKLCPHCPKDCSGNGSCRESGCECVAGYYGADCGQQCHVTCASCSGPNHCLTCHSLSSLTPSGTCECAIGFVYRARMCVWDSVTCHPQCLTCKGPLATDCLSCVHSASIDSSGICSCEKGRIWSGNECIPCASDCLTFSGPADSDCTQCFAHAQLTAFPGKCTCESGFFPTIAECSACDSSCLTCTSEKACTSCKAASAELTSGRCLCLAGFYLTIAGEDCSPCYPTCAVCYGPGAYHCEACGPAAVLAPASNQCVCQQGFVRTPDLSACQSNALLCVPNFTPLSVLLLLFCVQLFAGKRFLHQPPVPQSSPVVGTELPLLHPPAVPFTPAVSSGHSHYVFRLGVLATVLMWGGFMLEWLYYLSYSHPEDETTAKGSLWTFNLNDSAYILVTFVQTLSLDYLLFKLYSAYRVSGRCVGTALGLSLGTIGGVIVLCVRVCGESGGLWMGGFFVLLGLEVSVSQLVLRTLCQSLP